jgi:hypothetical protein
MTATSVQLWDAIYHLGSVDLISDNILTAVIAKLIKFKMAALDTAGPPQLTPYDLKCFTVIESGDGVVPELKDLAATEDERPR